MPRSTWGSSPENPERGRAVKILTAGLVRRAAELDNRYADLNLGFADTSLMAIAERHEMPILTFHSTSGTSGPPNRPPGPGA